MPGAPASPQAPLRAVPMLASRTVAAAVAASPAHRSTWRFSETVTAICESAVVEDAEREGMALAPGAGVAAAAFVLGQWQRMPDYLRWPIFVLTIFFDLSALPSHRARFHRCGPDARRRHVDAWRSSRLGPARDLVRFYDALAIYCLYSTMMAELDAAAAAVVPDHACELV